MEATREAPPRWRRRPGERPDEILDAAFRVFAQQGVARARVEDIAELAGVSKGTVYLYFDSKEELFRAAIRNRIEHTVNMLESAAPAGDPVEQIERFVDAYWKRLRHPSFGAMYRLLLSETPQLPGFAQFFGEEVSGKVLDVVARIVQEGIAQGSFRRLDPAVAARMIVALIVQHAIWTSHPKLFPRVGNRPDAGLGDELKQFVLAALLDPAREGAAR